MTLFFAAGRQERFRRLSVFQLCKPFQRRQARHEEVLAAAKHVESFDAMDAASHRLLRNAERCAFFLQPDNWITFITGADEIAVIDPLLLQEFDRGHSPGADEKKDCAARHFVICFRQRVFVVRWSIRRASPDYPVDVDVSKPREFRVSRVHPPDMTSERYLPPARIV